MFRTRFLALTWAVLLAGCGAADPVDPTLPEGTLAKSEKQRIASPAVAVTDLQQLAGDNAAFAVDLFQKLRAAKGNLFYSPHSISIALAMTYAGARSATEAEMAKVLHYTLPQSALHPAFNALDQALASRGKGAAGKDGGKFRLKIANALWGQRGYPFLPSFLDLLAENYGAGMQLMNFRDQPEPSRIAINDWVAQQTEDKIKDLIPAGAITPITTLVLTNAIYFNAAWADPFQKEATSRGEFTRIDGSKQSAELMVKTSHLSYANAEGWQAVEMPYDGRELSMVLMLPGAGLEQAEAALTPGALQRLLAGLTPDEVRLTLPKFKVESKFELKDTLEELGMTQAFHGADFSGIDGRKFLEIGQVIHKAFIEIDEAGTEAAAATAVIVGPPSVPPPPKLVRFDRPFLFLIRDLATGAVLFVGRVVEPKV